MSTLQILTASPVDAILAICSLARRERETGDQFGRTIQPKYGVFTYTQIWLKKKSLTLKLRFFLVSVVYARLYDSAASSASPLGSAASLAITS